MIFVLYNASSDTEQFGFGECDIDFDIKGGVDERVKNTWEKMRQSVSQKYLKKMRLRTARFITLPTAGEERRSGMSQNIPEFPDFDEFFFVSELSLIIRARKRENMVGDKAEGVSGSERCKF